MPKIVIKPNENGDIVISKETLEQLGDKPIEMRREADGISIEPRVDDLLNLVTGSTYEIWSPYDADEAAREALEFLKEYKAKIA